MLTFEQSSRPLLSSLEFEGRGLDRTSKLWRKTVLTEELELGQRVVADLMDEYRRPMATVYYRASSARAAAVLGMTW